VGGLRAASLEREQFWALESRSGHVGNISSATVSSRSLDSEACAPNVSPLWSGLHACMRACVRARGKTGAPALSPVLL
jgi:hypothetical protein